ncbi:MAG: porin [Burkholderiaceae bacterium]
MKKHLIAAAVAAAFAVPAMAQVTVYGVADLGLGSADGSSQMISNGKMNNGNSRWGLRGTEDLGGGLKASFNFEAGINAETGATDAAYFQRNAFLALDGGFGQIRLGRGLSAGWAASGGTYDITGSANYSVIGNLFGWVGGVRNNSELRYTTPSLNGFSAAVGVLQKDDNNGSSKTDANIIYRGGPIAIGAAWSKPQGSQQSTQIGASYNFGPAKVAVSYHDPAGAAKGYTLGLSAPIGATTISFDMGKETGLTDSTDFVIEAKYALSKRTFVYGAGYRDGSRTTDKNSYNVGVRHNF